MKKQSSLPVFAAILFALTSCEKQTNDATPMMSKIAVQTSATNPQTLIFRSDFNSSTTSLTNSTQSEAFSGANGGYNWNLLNVPYSSDYHNNGTFGIEYETGTNADRRASITTDDAPNTAEGILKFSITKATTPTQLNAGADQHKQRVQAAFFQYRDIIQGSGTTGNYLKEFYQKVTLKLHSTSFNNVLLNQAVLVPGTSDWITLFELFNGVPQDFSVNANAYRVGITLKKTADKQHFIIVVDSQKGSAAGWDKTSTENWTAQTPDTYNIEPGKWYTYETYMQEGIGGTNGSGRFWLKITNNSTNAVAYLGSMTSPLATQSTNDATSNGFDHIYPMKLYTSGDVVNAAHPSTLQAYFGSWELYNHR